MIAALRLVAQLAIVAHVPDSAQTCDAIDVSVAISAPAGVTPQFVPPTFAQFELLRAAGVQQTTTGGRTIFDYNYTLTTAQPGDFFIPSFAATVAGQTVRTPAHRLVVRPSRVRAGPTVIARARIDTSIGPSLSVGAAAETVFVGQQATYEVAVFLNQTARERLRRNPTFYPPEMQAMLAYDLPVGASAYRPGRSQCFDALVYRRALFPLIPGRIVIPPAQLVYSIGLSSTSLFSREESRELETDSVSIVAVDPPAVGRPADYAGAVGQMQVASQFDSVPSRVGDPMLFTMRVKGTGNVKLFPRPALAIPWANVVPADERVRVDSSGVRVSGAKEFDWVVTPRIAGEFDVPPLRYGYFDPARGQYDVAETQPLHLSVGAGALASADTGRAETVLPIRMQFRGETGAPLHSRPTFWFVLALAPIPALVARGRRRRTERARETPEDPMRALQRTAESVDVSALRRQFLRVLAQRLGCSPEDFTRIDALDRALRRAGVSPSTSARAEALLRQMDSAAYAGGQMPLAAGRDALAVARAVDREALARSELPFWIPAIVVALIAVTATATAGDPAAAHFARGVSAYVRSDFAVARDAFASAVTLAPRSSDAWANYGTAAWAASDTADAVFGWRQSLALEPDADDAQQRMTLAHDFGMEDPGWVPAVPRDAPALLFLFLWIAACALALVGVRPAYAWARHWPMPLAVAAMLIGLGSIELQQRITGASIAVVRTELTVVSDPALGLDRGASLATGEVVRVVGRRGVWTRIESTAGREGWLPSSELLTLSSRRPPAAPRN